MWARGKRRRSAQRKASMNGSGVEWAHGMTNPGTWRPPCVGNTHNAAPGEQGARRERRATTTRSARVLIFFLAKFLSTPLSFLHLPLLNFLGIFVHKVFFFLQVPLFLGFLLLSLVSVVVLCRFHSSLLCSCILSLPSLLLVFDLCVYLDAFGFQ